MRYRMLRLEATHYVIYIFAVLRAPSRATSCEDTLNMAKVKIMHCFAFSLKVSWYESMEWNMEENFSMKWKIFIMEWIGMEQNCQHGIWKKRHPSHFIPCPGWLTFFFVFFSILQGRFRISVQCIIIRNCHPNFRSKETK